MGIGTALLIALLGLMIVIAVLIVIILLLSLFNVSLEPTLNLYDRIKKAVIRGGKKIFGGKKQAAGTEPDMDPDGAIVTDEEEIAAIAAAVECYLSIGAKESNGLEFVVKSIKRRA